MTLSDRINDLERDLLTLAAHNPNAAEIVAAMAPTSWQDAGHARIAQAIKELVDRGEDIGLPSIGKELTDEGVRSWFRDWGVFTERFNSKTTAFPASVLRKMIEEAAFTRKTEYVLTDGLKTLADGHHPQDVILRVTSDLPCLQPAEANNDYQPFPVDVLPDCLRNFVIAGASSIVCDAGIIALPMLIALAGAIGSRCRLRIKNGWDAKPILWGAVVGESGTTKTPVFELVLKPLQDFQNRCFADFSAILEEYALKKLQYESALQKWKKPGSNKAQPPQAPEEPQAQRILVEDPTIEALAPILLSNQRGLLLAKDELSGWFGSFNRYRSGKGGGDEARYLSMFNGLSFTIDRKTGQPRTIHVPSGYLSICGGIQPSVLRRIWSGEHLESGMAARFLLAFPPRKPKVYSEATVSPELLRQWAGVIEKLLELRPEIQEAYIHRLSESAQSRAIAWINMHNQEQAAQTGSMAAAYSKLEETPFRLALILHQAKIAAGDVATFLEVDLDSLEPAIAITEWFKNEARRIYKLFGCRVHKGPQASLLSWMTEQGGTVKPRDVAMNLRDYRGIGGTEKARAMLEQLVLGGQCERDEQGNYQPTRQHANTATTTTVGVGTVDDDSQSEAFQQ